MTTMSQVSASSARTQDGFTLVEALVSLLILSIGLLGLAGLQASGLRSNQGAYARSQAVILAQDAMERILANPAETSAALAGGGNSAYQLARGTDPTSPPDCENSDCSPTALAQYDVATWKQAITNLLPGGDASIVRNGSIFAITVFWDEQHTGNAADMKQVTLTMDVGA